MDVAVGETVNFNTGEGIVRAEVKRLKEDTKVYLWAPERGSGYVKLHKGDEDPDGSGIYPGIPRRAPADYGPEGGGLTYHTLDEATEEAEG